MPLPIPLNPLGASDKFTALVSRIRSVVPGAEIIEYIESDGYAFVPTGLQFAQSQRVVVEASFSKVQDGSGDKYIFRSVPVDGNNRIDLVNFSQHNYATSRMGGGIDLFSLPISANTRYSFDLTFTNGPSGSLVGVAGGLKVNKTFSNVVQQAADSQINILRGSTSQTYLLANHGNRVYAFSMPGRCTLVPIKAGGTVSCFDLARNMQLTNGGAGAFIAGPIVTNWRLQLSETQKSAWGLV